MGNKINTTKFIDLTILVVSLASFVYVGFPTTHKILSGYRISYYHWQTPAPVISLVDTRKMPSARAVPILMYHGVLEDLNDANTTQDNFESQMRMLKENGYQTISVAEYDLFRQDKFVLPPKPIIITFDDGRKDSYYSTDDIFRQLGFKATIFVASTKAIDQEPFYLSWQELATMRDSGRWEIEAHGRRSHEVVLASAPGSNEVMGRYLTSRMWLPDKNRLETVLEFQARVMRDYADNIYDLKVHLGVDAKYLAIPLNDYGQTPLSNNPEAAKFNHGAVEKMFRMAFIEANGSEAGNDTHMVLPVYNYKSDNPHILRRIEVRNIPAEKLKQILDSQFPTDPNIDLRPVLADRFLSDTRLDYGFMTANKIDGLRLKTIAINTTAKFRVGDPHWDNYDVTAIMERKTGRSIFMTLYSPDEKNYLAFGLTDNGVFLRRRVDGRDTQLSPSLSLSNIGIDPNGLHTYRLVWKNGHLDAYFDDRLVFADISPGPGPYQGSLGIKVWDDKVLAEGVIQSLKLSPAKITSGV